MSAAEEDHRRVERRLSVRSVPDSDEGADGLVGGPIDGPDLDVTLHRRALEVANADRLLAVLSDEIMWKQEHIWIYGRLTPVPRLTAWYGDPGLTYTYSGITMTPAPWTPSLLEVRAAVEALAGTHFNTVLLNRYRNGRDGVRWHADDEPELGAAPVIASVSLGATRRFQMRRRDEPSERRSIDMHHADVLIMRGPTQQHWLHQVPQTSRTVGERVNLTFRRVGTPDD